MRSFCIFSFGASEPDISDLPPATRPVTRLKRSLSLSQAQATELKPGAASDEPSQPARPAFSGAALSKD